MAVDSGACNGAVLISLHLGCCWDQDAAERGRLGGSTFKKLCFGSAAYCLIVDYLSIVSPTLSGEAAAVIDPEKLPSFISAVAIAGSQIVVLVYQGLFAVV